MPHILKKMVGKVDLFFIKSKSLNFQKILNLGILKKLFELNSM